MIRFNELDIIIMAGGLGKRMNSNMPKILHLLDDKPLLVHVLINANQLLPQNIYLVVGKYKNVIKEVLELYLNIDNVTFVEQEEPLGTGHAVQCVMPHLIDSKNKVLILSGDVPFLSTKTLHYLFIPSKVCIMSADIDNPTGYGRIIKENDRFVKIVEEKDCSESEKKIKTINTGVYSIDANILCKYLPQLNNDNAQNEYYLTDLFAMINEEVEVIHLHKSKNFEISGVNTKQQLKDLEHFIEYRRQHSDYAYCI